MARTAKTALYQGSLACAVHRSIVLSSSSQFSQILSAERDGHLWVVASAAIAAISGRLRLHFDP